MVVVSTTVVGAAVEGAPVEGVAVVVELTVELGAEELVVCLTVVVEPVVAGRSGVDVVDTSVVEVEAPDFGTTNAD